MARDKIHFIPASPQETCLTVVSSFCRTGHSPDEATQLKAHWDSVVTRLQNRQLGSQNSHDNCRDDLGSQNSPDKMSKVPTMPTKPLEKLNQL